MASSKDVVIQLLKVNYGIKLSVYDYFEYSDLPKPYINSKGQILLSRNKYDKLRIDKFPSPYYLYSDVEDLRGYADTCRKDSLRANKLSDESVMAGTICNKPDRVFTDYAIAGSKAVSALNYF